LSLPPLADPANGDDGRLGARIGVLRLAVGAAGYLPINARTPRTWDVFRLSSFSDFPPFRERGSLKPEGTYGSAVVCQKLRFMGL
jgi:hypothetical protein